MKRYIDADAVLDRLPDDLPYKGSVKRVLMQAPTADVVEVVRCKDCKCKDDGMLYCDLHGEFIEQEGFCSYGERIDGCVTD